MNISSMRGVLNMKISTFSGMNSNETGIVDQIVDVTWSDLQNLVCKTLWAPSTFRADDSGVVRRQKDRFDSTPLLALDIDGGMSLEEAKLAFAPYKAFIGTTKSHQLEKNGKPKCDRFRVVIELERPISDAQEYAATWQKAQSMWPMVDNACSDTSRFYFECTEVVNISEGKPFSVETAATSLVAPQKSAAIAYELKPGEEVRLADSTHYFAQHGAPEGQWHHAFVKACKDLKQNLYSEEEAIRFFEAPGKFTLDEKHDLVHLAEVYKNALVYPPRIIKRAVSQPQLGNSDDGVYVRRPIEDLLKVVNEEEQRRKEAQRDAIPFLCTAFDGVFKLSMGLTLIGAETGAGKSTTAANVLAHFFSHTTRLDAFVITNEETSEDTYSRVACSRLKKNWFEYRDGKMSDIDQMVVKNMVKTLASRIEIVNDTKWDMSYIEDVIAVLESAAMPGNNIGLVAIDYFQTICRSRKNPTANAYDVYKELGSYLKDYGRRVKVPVLLFAQINPTAEDRRFAERVQGDTWLGNHAHTQIEVVPDKETLTAEFIFHKTRFGLSPAPVTVKWNGGRYEKYDAAAAATQKRKEINGKRIDTSQAIGAMAKRSAEMSNKAAPAMLGFAQSPTRFSNTDQTEDDSVNVN